MVAEEAELGRDAATFEVVIEAASPLTRSLIEDLGAYTRPVVVSP